MGKLCGWWSLRKSQEIVIRKLGMVLVGFLEWDFIDWFDFEWD